jgi:hypothetical protein
MTQTWKDNWEESKQRYIDWWNGKGLVISMWEHLQEGVMPHEDFPSPPPPENSNQRWFDPVWRSRQLHWSLSRSSFLADIPPVASTHLGPASLAAILGGVYEAGDDTIWIHPAPNQVEDIVFDPENTAWKLHLQLLRNCKALSKNCYYVGMPDLGEGLDILGTLRGTEEVFIDMMEEGELVERQLQQINDIYFKVFDELYEIIREGNEMAFCYFSLWAPDRMTKLQSDISIMIGEGDFRRFVSPYLEEQCRRIPYTLYHLDGVGAIRHLEALLEIEELNAIQWTPGETEKQGGDPKWYDLYRRILAGGKSVMAAWVQIEELQPLLDAVGPEGLHIMMDFKNERDIETALKIAEKFR